MILNLDNKLMIDVDKISLVDVEDQAFVIDGALWYGGCITDYIDIIAKAFKWQHQTHTYDKNLKRIK